MQFHGFGTLLNYLCTLAQGCGQTSGFDGVQHLAPEIFPIRGENSFDDFKRQWLSPSRQMGMGFRSGIALL